MSGAGGKESTYRATLSLFDETGRVGRDVRRVPYVSCPRTRGGFQISSAQDASLHAFRSSALCRAVPIVPSLCREPDHSRVPSRLWYAVRRSRRPGCPLCAVHPLFVSAL